MTVFVADITALKAISITQKTTRWVESERAWFASDPSSSATADDLYVVAPTAGSGRWLRQTNPPAVGYTWQSKTANFSAAAGYAYAVDTGSAGADIVATLPASPTQGQKIKILLAGSAQYPTYRVQIALNSVKVNGTTYATGLLLFRRGQYIEFEYLDSNTGWVTLSNQSLQAYTSLITLTKPGSLSSSQNGVFYTLGTDNNTLAWANPRNPGGGRKARIAVQRLCLGGWVSFASLDSAADRNPSSWYDASYNYDSSSSGYGGFKDGVAFSLINDDGNFCSLRLEDMFYAVTDSSALIRYMEIKATNLPSPEISSIANFTISNVSAISNWTRLYKGDVSLLTNGAGPSYISSHNSRYVPVAATEFYNTFLIRAYQHNPVGYQYLSEIEFYGDLLYVA